MNIAVLVAAKCCCEGDCSILVSTQVDRIDCVVRKGDR